MAMHRKLTAREVQQWASSFLNTHLEIEQNEQQLSEYNQMIERLLIHAKQWDKTQWLLHLNQPVEWNVSLLETQLQQLATGMPVQYILGYETFLDRDYMVNKAVLIPRPETEELVLHVCDFLQTKKQGNALEIGVGSGCIILSLALAAPTWQFIGTDISQAALEVAQKNCEHHRVENVTFCLSDVWETIPPTEKYSVIVSNPPYISVKEKQVMDRSVIGFEPATALFAKEEGLQLYRRIAEQLEHYLMPQGRAFFEIGYRQGAAVKAMFEQFVHDRLVTVTKDLSGHDRIITVYEQGTAKGSE